MFKDYFSMGKNISWRTFIDGHSGGVGRKLDCISNFTGLCVVNSK